MHRWSHPHRVPSLGMRFASWWPLAPIWLAASVFLPVAAGATDPGRLALGERLFADTRLHNPAGDLELSCATCHARADKVGFRGFTDPLGRSWHPWRNEDPGRETLRNAPGLFDLNDDEFIHSDGEFTSLEAQAE